MLTVEERTNTLNKLLRVELSAVETYRQALQKLIHDRHAIDLHRIEEEHLEAAYVLRQHVTQRGAQAPNDPGLWGMWAKVVEGIAQWFGPAAALQALKKGEEHGIKEYEKALQDSNLDPECQTLICSDLLPRARQHIPILDRLINAHE